MHPDDPLTFDPALIAPGRAVADVGTKPIIMALLDAAARRGLVIQTGNEMVDI